MSDRPTSFHDFKWACGHTGPGYCKTCRDEQIEAKDKRIAELEAELKATQANEYQLAEANKPLLARACKAEAENERLIKIIQGNPASLGQIDENQWLRAVYGAAKAYDDVKSNPRTNIALNLIGSYKRLREALAAAKENDV